MTDIQRHKARSLVTLSLNDDGQVDVERVTEVLRGLQRSKVGGCAEIFRFYMRQLRYVMRQQVGRVISASELSADTKSTIEQSLRHRHPQIQSIDYVVEPALIGGMTIQAGDTWYDLSLKGKLQIIEEQLAQ